MYQTKIKGVEGNIEVVVKVTNRQRIDMLKRWNPENVKYTTLICTTSCPLCKQYEHDDRDSYKCQRCPLNHDGLVPYSCGNVIEAIIGEGKIGSLTHTDVEFNCKQHAAAKRYVGKVRDVLLGMKKV